MSTLTIGAASLNQTPFDWAGNMQNIREAIAQAKEKKVDILCLPELCITGYGCEDVFLSEWLPTKALQLLGEIKERCRHVGFAAPVFLPARK